MQENRITSRLFFIKLPKYSISICIFYRNCPVCHDDISWLPKLACCPKCGYKPVPVIQEKCYNENLTAQEVLAEYLDKDSSNSDIEEGCPEAMRAMCDEQKECRCTCKFGKICAHCRIRKLCADIFKTDNADKNANSGCGKCDANPMDDYNICKTESNDCRPYLARVFSELRDLYDIKERQKSGFDINARCEAELNRHSSSFQSQKIHDPKKELAKIMAKRRADHSPDDEEKVENKREKCGRPKKKKRYEVYLKAFISFIHFFFFAD